MTATSERGNTTRYRSKLDDRIRPWSSPQWEILSTNEDEKTITRSTAAAAAASEPPDKTYVTFADQVVYGWGRKSNEQREAAAIRASDPGPGQT
jgi:hypothetical protein